MLLLHGIQNDSTFISQITSSSLNMGVNAEKRYAAGHDHPLAIYNLSQDLSATFSTTQLKTVLDLCGMGIGDLSEEDTILRVKAMAKYASRVGDAEEDHYSYTAADCVLVPQTISATQGGSLAELSAMLHFPFDGTNEPLVPAGGVALAGTPSHSQGYGLGPIFLNNSAVNGVQGVTIDFGNVVKVRASDGDLYPTFIATETKAPVITFQCYRESVLAYGINGTALTGISAYLRAKGPAANVANSTAAHIKFSGTAGMIYVDEVTGGNNDDSISTVRVELIAPNAAGVGLAVNTAIAITT